ncbi:hypothetical protein PNOK_0002700 [Pyrrhoderma noxium]|uniref:Uncharacterized protein n=1 Tax=Pyrrhoderma noxium TaxID=2282107 RepID=A0A286UTM6_9AGAM|nr:hypothetical protein PNOK_0002700 [Pyrrhoderma noxium]
MSHLSKNNQVQHPLRSAHGRSIISSSNNTTPPVPITRAPSIKRETPPAIKKRTASVAKKNSTTLRTTPPTFNALPIGSSRPNPVPSRAPIDDNKAPEPGSKALLLQKVSYAIGATGYLPEKSLREKKKQDIKDDARDSIEEYKTKMEGVTSIIIKKYQGKKDEREIKKEIIKEKHKINLEFWAALNEDSVQGRLRDLLDFMKEMLTKLEADIKRDNGANIQLYERVFCALISMYSLYIKLESIESQVDMYLFDDQDLECTWFKPMLDAATHAKPMVEGLRKRWKRTQADINGQTSIKEVTVQRINQMVTFCEGKIEINPIIIKDTNYLPGGPAPLLIKPQFEIKAIRSHH